MAMEAYEQNGPTWASSQALAGLKSLQLKRSDAGLGDTQGG
jgi:hypothetical protein